jgi:hypothetical protein
MRSPGGYDKKRVFFLQACPARRQSRHITAMVSIEKKIVAPVNTPLNEVERLSKQWVKGMRDSNFSSHTFGATCSSSIDRKHVSLIQPIHNSSDGLLGFCALVHHSLADSSPPLQNIHGDSLRRRHRHQTALPAQRATSISTMEQARHDTSPY